VLETQSSSSNGSDVQAPHLCGAELNQCMAETSSESLLLQEVHAGESLETTPSLYAAASH